MHIQFIFGLWAIMEVMCFLWNVIFKQQKDLTEISTLLSVMTTDFFRVYICNIPGDNYEWPQ